MCLGSNPRHRSLQRHGSLQASKSVHFKALDFGLPVCVCGGGGGGGECMLMCAYMFLVVLFWRNSVLCTANWFYKGHVIGRVDIKESRSF